MKTPVLTEKATSSYFSSRSPVSSEDRGETVDKSPTLSFPKYKKDLWNTTPCGDTISFGIHHYHPVSLICLERCLRLAHRHATHQNHQTMERGHIHGFLMGSTTYTDDESGIIINVDRFDPGTIRGDNHRSPSTPLPGDVIIPIVFSKSTHSPDVNNAFSVRDYENAFKLLHHQVSSRLSFENTSLLPIRLHCFYDEGGSRGDDIQLHLQWVSPCISNALQATPIKPVPIILTALAKNLAGPLNLSHIQNCSKTGYLSMNQSRKLLLLLDSDPKSRSLPTVGIWVSGVVSVHNPVVWLACMRYLYCADIYERIMTTNQQFLLILYSVTSQSPMYFQVKADDNTKLSFDLLHAQQSIQIGKTSSNDSENVVEFRLEPSSVSGVSFKERELFHEALSNMDPFLAPAKSTEEDDQRRGRQPRKAPVPQSILRNNSNGRRSLSGRGRNTASGVSFSLAVDDTDNPTDVAPMPMPSPLPSTAFQSPPVIKPVVPELSLIFDENFPIPGQGLNGRQPSRSPTKKRSMSDKLQTTTPGIRSPLKNINNLNPANRGISPQDRRSLPMKTTNSYRGPTSLNINQHNIFYHANQGNNPMVPPSAAAPAMRRSRSASDCLRGAANVNAMYPPRSAHPPRPIMSHTAYNPRLLQGAGNPVHASIPARAVYPQNIPHHMYHIHPSRPPVPYPYTPIPSHSNSATHPSQIQLSASTPYSASGFATMATRFPGAAPDFTPAPTQTPYHTNLLMTPCPVVPEMPTAHTSHNAPQVTHNAPQVTLNAPQGTHNATRATHNAPQTSHNATQITHNAIPSSTPTTGFQDSLAGKKENLTGGSGPAPQSNVTPVGGSLPAESPAWMKQLPPEAYQLLMHQDAQLKQLQAQIQKLLAMQDEPSKVKQKEPVMKETSTEMGSGDGSKVSMGVNTGTSLYIPNAPKSQEGRDEQDASSTTTPTSTKSSPMGKPHPALLDTPGSFRDTEADVASEAAPVPAKFAADVPGPTAGLRCESQCTDKYQASEFASILLDDLNLQKIASTNNEDDSDRRSLASSLRAVDLPVLETSTEQSSFGTPTSKMGGGWTMQDSPVLGESASMCIVPPINLNKSLQEAEEEEAVRQEEGDGKDEMFMTNLLSQVRDMLKKADIDGKSEISSESSAASATKQRKIASKKQRLSQEDRVARATKKQLQKMGVDLDDDTVNVLSLAVSRKEKRSDDFPFTFPEPLIPRLNYVSMMAGGSASSSVFPGPSSTELSMHANAIALKYLSNDQLEEIATLSKLGKNTSTAFSPFKTKSQTSSHSSKNAEYDPFPFNIEPRGQKQLPGMSLVSPCNMSLATRKYMQKYGLIDAEESEEEEEAEEEEGFKENKGIPSPPVLLRPVTPEPRSSKPASRSASPILKGVRQSMEQMVQADYGHKEKEGVPEKKAGSKFSGAEHDFSELKMSLGDTLDMILPFLDDLDRLRQQTPSSGTNGRDSRSGTGTRSSQTSSGRGTAGNTVDRPTLTSSDSPAGERDSIERVLSPQVLQALSQVHAHLRSNRERATSSRPSSRRSNRGDNHHVSHPSPSSGEKTKSKPRKNENEVSQVLSPKLLQALAEGRRMTTATTISSARVNVADRNWNGHEEQNEEEDFLAGTWPECHFRARTESANFRRGNVADSAPSPQEGRRLSTSPMLPGNHSRRHQHHEYRRHGVFPPSSFKTRRVRAIQDGTYLNTLEDLEEAERRQDAEDGALRKDTRSEDEEPVLTSRVTDAFREKEETSKVTSKEQSERNGDAHFLQHLQNANRSEKFLDMDKIRNLPKFS